MNINISLKRQTIERLQKTIASWPWLLIVAALSVVFSVSATIYFYLHGNIISYGDAESHLNIAKRVVSSLTPGMAQLGGIWLPLPHVLLVPFVYFDPLWRSGIAGAIVSGIGYIVTCVILYKLIFLITKSKLASFFGFLIFAINPNILYMQSTPLTEIPLITFFMLSSYFFTKYLLSDQDFLSLIYASFFGFCATLSRYDGWFLVLFEAVIIIFMYVTHKTLWKKMQGRVILFSTLAFFGILLWFLWGLVILGDPLYFTHSQFSAKSQQQGFLARGELPAYKNILVSLLYYSVTTLSNLGVIIFFIGIIGMILYAKNTTNKHRFYFLCVVFSPFILNVYSLFAGQSVIFIPDVTPVGFQWRLFNARYGTIMIPVLAFFSGYLFYKVRLPGKVVIICLLLFQLLLYGIGYSRNIVLADGIVGLSHAKSPSAEYWMAKHYDHGLVLLDDYARTMSVIRSGIPMQNVIYIGTKPYWEESFRQPEKYATWIIMQKNDDVWKNIYDKPDVRARMYKYFEKVYTSPEILIFKRNPKINVN